MKIIISLNFFFTLQKKCILWQTVTSSFMGSDGINTNDFIKDLMSLFITILCLVDIF